MKLKNSIRFAAILVVAGIVFSNFTLVQAQSTDWAIDGLGEIEVAPTGSGYDNGGLWDNVPALSDVFPFEASPVILAVDPDALQAADEAALNQFVETVSTGQANVVTGVFVGDVLSLPVRQQLSGGAAYVSTEDDVATQFSMSSQYGSIGLLAHNNLAGELFFDLAAGQEVSIVYGDGTVERYVITETRHFQALSPYSPYSNFLDIDNNNANYSATELFYEVYANVDTVVFQTCIGAEGIDSWGRLFILAELIS
ncbi:MAG: hypothetical protein MUO76_01905 [Anaerolineaceae bacterium]|nr:hypothetical protein [Anaerolineaceae bacterium]